MSPRGQQPSYPDYRDSSPETQPSSLPETYPDFRDNFKAVFKRSDSYRIEDNLTSFGSKTLPSTIIHEEVEEDTISEKELSEDFPGSASGISLNSDEIKNKHTEVWNDVGDLNAYWAKDKILDVNPQHIDKLASNVTDITTTTTQFFISDNDNDEDVDILRQGSELDFSVSKRNLEEEFSGGVDYTSSILEDEARNNISSQSTDNNMILRALLVEEDVNDKDPENLAPVYDSPDVGENRNYDRDNVIPITDPNTENYSNVEGALTIVDVNGSEWTENFTEAGDKYYTNKISGETSWFVDQGEYYYDHDYSTDYQHGNGVGTTETYMPQEQHQSISNYENSDGLWQEAHTDDGNLYYFNTITGESSWTHPDEELERTDNAHLSRPPRKVLSRSNSRQDVVNENRKVDSRFDTEFREKSKNGCITTEPALILSQHNQYELHNRHDVGIFESNINEHNSTIDKATDEMQDNGDNSAVVNKVSNIPVDDLEVQLHPNDTLNGNNDGALTVVDVNGSEWTENFTEAGDKYYTNKISGETSWFVDQGEYYYDHDYSTDYQHGNGVGTTETYMPQEQHQSISNYENSDGLWQEAHTDDGNLYYFNTITGESSWTHPNEELKRTATVQSDYKAEPVKRIISRSSSLQSDENDSPKSDMQDVPQIKKQLSKTFAEVNAQQTEALNRSRDKKKADKSIISNFPLFASSVEDNLHGLSSSSLSETNQSENYGVINLPNFMNSAQKTPSPLLKKKKSFKKARKAKVIKKV